MFDHFPFVGILLKKKNFNKFLHPLEIIREQIIILPRVKYDGFHVILM